MLDEMVLQLSHRDLTLSKSIQFSKGENLLES